MILPHLARLRALRYGAPVFAVGEESDVGYSPLNVVVRALQTAGPSLRAARFVQDDIFWGWTFVSPTQADEWLLHPATKSCRWGSGEWGIPANTTEDEAFDPPTSGALTRVQIWGTRSCGGMGIAKCGSFDSSAAAAFAQDDPQFLLRVGMTDEMVAEAGKGAQVLRVRSAALRFAQDDPYFCWGRDERLMTGLGTACFSRGVRPAPMLPRCWSRSRWLR